MNILQLVNCTTHTNCMGKRYLYLISKRMQIMASQKRVRALRSTHRVPIPTYDFNAAPTKWIQVLTPHIFNWLLRNFNFLRGSPCTYDFYGAPTQRIEVPLPHIVNLLVGSSRESTGYDYHTLGIDVQALQSVDSVMKSCRKP
jgi:hypothetical protein